MTFKIETNSNLLFKKVTKIEIEFFRKIEWIGYMKNSLLDKKKLSCNNFNYNEDKHCFVSKITLLSEIDINKEFFDVFGLRGILGFIGIVNVVTNLYHYYNRFKEILKLDGEKDEFNEDINIASKFEKSINKLYDEKELKEISEELKKFVYFQDNKVAGFVKFPTNITPPVNGYYFNCSYNIYFNVHVSGVLIDHDKTLKNTIDFYDGNKYIQKMKKFFSINNSSPK